jgi:hypothetical protein
VLNPVLLAALWHDYHRADSLRLVHRLHIIRHANINPMFALIGE